MNNQFAPTVAGALNLVAIVLLLWIAIGITCEITSRNANYAAADGYQKWLHGCQKNGASDATCPKETDSPKLSDRADWAAQQMRQYNGLNSLGALDRCGIAAVIASPFGGFFQDCMKVMVAPAAVLDPKPARTQADIAADLKLNNKEQLQTIKEILSPAALSYSGWLALDQRAKEPLYFALVLIASAIGSLIAGLRVSGFTTLRDIALGLGAGFVVYILVRSGNFVFLTGDTSHVDILNPFTTGGVGFLVGLFKDRAFGLLDGAVRQPGGAAPAQKAMGDAEKALENAKAQQTPQAFSEALTAFKQAHDEVKKL